MVRGKVDGTAVKGCAKKICDQRNLLNTSDVAVQYGQAAGIANIRRAATGWMRNKGERLKTAQFKMVYTDVQDDGRRAIELAEG